MNASFLFDVVLKCQKEAMLLWFCHTEHLWVNACYLEPLQSYIEVCFFGCGNFMLNIEMLVVKKRAQSFMVLKLANMLAIWNTGQHCYLNSLLHSLCNVPHVHELLQEHHEAVRNDSSKYLPEILPNILTLNASQTINAFIPYKYSWKWFHNLGHISCPQCKLHHLMGLLKRKDAALIGKHTIVPIVRGKSPMPRSRYHSVHSDKSNNISMCLKKISVNYRIWLRPLHSHGP